MTATEVSHLLAQRVEDLCGYLLPNGENRGGEWCVGSLSGEPGGSLKIPLHGPKLGMFRDFAGADTDRGDLIGLWKAVKNVDITTAYREALEWLNIPQEQRNGYRVTQKPAQPKAIDAHWTELQSKLRPGTRVELQSLADQRKLGGTAGLEIATSKGQLFFTDVYDFGERHPAWILTDSARLNGQARKIDGTEWKFDGRRKPAKSKTVWSPEAGWPVGINDVGINDVVLVEGNPDFLAAHQAIWMSGKPLAPVGIFGASTVICDEALEKFSGKTVYLMAHSEEDGVGLKAAQRWERQLKAAGAMTVLKTFSQDGVKDLNDLLSFAVTADQEELVTSLWPDRTMVAEEENWDTVPSAIPPTDGIAPLIQTGRRSLFSFNLIPDGHESILLGDRYLNRGDGAVLVSTSGMGKSSAAIQMAAELALNMGPFGIQGNGPLRSLIMQSEDSDGDVAEVAYSLKHVLKLSDDQINTVNQRVNIVTDRVNRGLRFIAHLKKHIAEFKPDLVFINPLQAFMDGDVTESKDLGAFLREGLNGLNEPATFGYIIVHHTTKPSKPQAGAKSANWNEVMYDMAGGAEIINWARAIISLRASIEEGDFNMVLAKRGRRAGVTRKVPQGTGWILEPITTIPLRHAKGRIEIPGIKRGLPLIYWEDREPDVKEEKAGKNTGAPVKYQFNDYRNLFPGKHTSGVPLAELHRMLMPNGEIKRNILHAVCVRWGEDVDIIDLPNQPRRYRASL